MQNVAIYLDAVRHIADRTPLPDRLFCPACGYIQAGMEPQFVRWARRYRSDLVTERYGGGLEPQPATQCRCVDAEAEERRRRGRIMADANLPLRQGGVGRRTIKNFAHVAGAADMVRALGSWMVGDGPPVLVYVGVTGCGKSHLLEAAVYSAAEQGISARYDRSEDYLTRLRASNARDSDEDSSEVLAWYRGLSMLALDDVGQVRPTAWGLDQLTALIDQRIADGARLLLATNYMTGVEFVDAMGMEGADRLASRMYDRGSGSVRVVYCRAGDYRQGR